MQVALDDHGDAGLLEHYFRDPDGVSVAAVSPGQIAAVARVPLEQRAADRAIFTASRNPVTMGTDYGICLHVSSPPAKPTHGE